MTASSTGYVPTKNDSYPTATSLEQSSTESVIAQFAQGTTKLDRNAHLNFLVRLLMQGMPARYVSQDASQPWIVFWIVQSVSLLGAGMDDGNKQRIIDTVLAFQHPDGGFGGGPGQFPHALTTYASVCALAIVGKPGKGGGWDDIDREGIYRFFMSIKQPDGSFLVGTDMEVDVRGTYCILVVSTLLGILTSELIHNTASFLASCQTYEGGFACASQPSFSPGTTDLLSSPRPPLGEAHGGYTSCVLASWLLLKQAGYIKGGEGSTEINLPRLVRWLVHLQGNKMELGGFKGRTNKLVDGCYSWWVGGCFGLVEALGVPVRMPEIEKETGKEAGDASSEWEDVEDTLFDREALQGYILLAAQSDSGGLRDKPNKNPDAYHTLYNLAGLAAAQHHVQPHPETRAKLESKWKSPPTTPSSPIPSPPEETLKRIWANALSWTESKDIPGGGGGGGEKIVGEKSNRVNAAHPLFNLTHTHVKGTMDYFYGQM